MVSYVYEQMGHISDELYHIFQVNVEDGEEGQLLEEWGSEFEGEESSGEDDYESDGGDLE